MLPVSLFLLSVTEAAVASLSLGGRQELCSWLSGSIVRPFTCMGVWEEDRPL